MLHSALCFSKFVRLTCPFYLQGTPKQVPKVVVKIEIEQEQSPLALPLYGKLARHLEASGVPLQFECGYACTCGTCRIVLQKEDYQRIIQDQPITQREQEVLSENGYDDQCIRLSCQLFIDKNLEGVTIKID